ncbi:potassium voltage-gated channel subfamily G member 4 isoform X2 [Sciurus carolinensis]|uniref:potassium voltage-gated channel subfamily G member 4 isoform X2 n=1 Tax=Sciurus carolinensis TaxID=30640 RepID=UPI001FB3C4EB|nr:potassium voltage-gated channel subfamily G member 4 isoform X2 [Sciurus carolinensis]
MPVPSGDGGLGLGLHRCGSYSPLSPPSPGPLETRAAKGLYYGRARRLGAGEAAPEADLRKEVLVNVGGRRFLLPWSTLDEFPRSRLAQLRLCRSREEAGRLCDDFDEDRQEFFFDRSPSAFGAIVSFLAAGKLVLLQDTCALSFREELAYWGIDERSLERCCLRRLLRTLEEAAELRREEALQRQRQREAHPAGRGSRWALCMDQLGEMVENPRSGLPGKVFACLSILFVATTAVSLCVSTMPDLRAEEDKLIFRTGRTRAPTGSIVSFFSPEACAAKPASPQGCFHVNSAVEGPGQGRRSTDPGPQGRLIPASGEGPLGFHKCFPGGDFQERSWVGATSLDNTEGQGFSKPKAEEGPRVQTQAQEIKSGWVMGLQGGQPRAGAQGGPAAWSPGSRGIYTHVPGCILYVFSLMKLPVCAAQRHPRGAAWRGSLFLWG